MIKTKKIILYKEVEEEQEVICDICGNSCSKDTYHDKGEGIAHFEYLQLETYWGYYSSKDLEHWRAQVCESCVDTHLVPLIQFNKARYPLHDRSRFWKRKPKEDSRDEK